MRAIGFLSIFIVLLIIFFSFLISIYITGKVERQYKVIELNKLVLFKNQSLTTENLTKQFLPEIYILKELDDIKPEAIYYEVIENGRNFSIVYRVVYPTENVPSYLLNDIYSAYRTLFYGSKKDIEFIQIDVDKKSGTINRVLFETNSASAKSLLQVHKLTEIIKYNYGYTMKTGENNQYLENLPLNDTHLQIAVVTWNHLFSLSNNIADYVKIGTLPLSYLDEEIYKEYKISRRSTGDFKSYENLNKVIFFFFLSILGLGVIKLSYL